MKYHEISKLYTKLLQDVSFATVRRKHAKSMIGHHFTFIPRILCQLYSPCAGLNIIIIESSIVVMGSIQYFEQTKDQELLCNPLRPKKSPMKHIWSKREFCSLHLILGGFGRDSYQTELNTSKKIKKQHRLVQKNLMFLQDPSRWFGINHQTWGRLAIVCLNIKTGFKHHVPCPNYHVGCHRWVGNPPSVDTPR